MTRLISFITYCLARLPIPVVCRGAFFRAFSKSVGINLDEVEKPLKDYATFNAFFTRSLKKGSRPISSKTTEIVSPVDGLVLQYGAIESGQLIQAKGVYYSVDRLLADSDASRFHNGSFICLYLAPRDCHLIFSPVKAALHRVALLPGALRPVREPYISRCHSLYVRNERLISYLSHKTHGDIAVAKVGALNVGTMTSPFLPNLHKETQQHVDLPSPISVKAGEQIGTFHLGSTVVLVFEKPVQFVSDDLGEVKYGQTIAKWV